MAENNLGNTQYFRTRPDQEIQVKECPETLCTMQWRKKDIIR